MSKRKVNRRQFFPMLFQELAVTAESAQGKRSVNLSQLAALPDDTIADMVPVINPEFFIQVQGGYVWAVKRVTETRHQLFPTNSPMVQIYNQFNGENTIAQAVRKLVPLLNIDEETAFKAVRSVFVQLAERSVCLPKYPPPGDLKTDEADDTDAGDGTA